MVSNNFPVSTFEPMFIFHKWLMRYSVSRTRIVKEEPHLQFGFIGAWWIYWTHSCKISIDSIEWSPFNLNWRSFFALALIVSIIWFLILVIVNAIMRPILVSNLISVKSFCGTSSIWISIDFSFDQILYFDLGHTVQITLL